MRQGSSAYLALAVLAASVLWQGGARAADYYVAPTGNDANPGTLAQPWATWDKVLATAKAGDAVYFREGEYTVAPPAGTDSRTMHGGTSEAPVKLKAYKDEKPVIKGDGLKRFVRVESPYWAFEGLTFIASRVADHSGGILIVGEDHVADHMVVKNCSFTIRGAAGHDNVACIILEGGDSRDALVQDCTFTGFGHEGQYEGAIGIQYLGGGNVGTKVLHNQFNNLNLGVYVKHANGDTATTGAEVAWNSICDCRHGLYGNPVHINYHDNLLVRCDIMFGDNGGGRQGHDNTVAHNTVYKGGLFLQNPGEGPIANCMISNNIFTGQVALSPWQSGSQTPHHSTLDYNLYMTGEAAFLELGKRYGLETWRAHDAGDAHSVAGAPVFVGGPAPAAPAGFVLAATSPGKNAASDGKDMGASMDLVTLTSFGADGRPGGDNVRVYDVVAKQAANPPATEEVARLVREFAFSANPKLSPKTEFRIRGLEVKGLWQQVQLQVYDVQYLIDGQ
jgi:hypothetical protein